MAAEMRHKQQQDENFPVASFLLAKKNQKIVTAYYNFARYGDDIADNPDLSEKEKLQHLNALEEALYGKGVEGSPESAVARPLRDEFMRENLSFSLAVDLLTAFKQDASNFHYKTWTQLTEYCR